MSEQDLPSFEDAFAAVRAAVRKAERFGPEVDTAALIVARECRSLISAKVALSWDDWTQLTAQIQVEVARAIRHAAFEKPEFPGKSPDYVHHYRHGYRYGDGI